MKAHKELLRDPLAYTEHLGKLDRQNTIAALQDKGKDTILRVCIAPRDILPFRTLGYLATLEHIGRTYLPNAQKQFVVSLFSAERVNGTTQKALDAAHEFFDTAWLHVPRHSHDTTDPTIFLFDKPNTPPVNLSRLKYIMRESPYRARLEAQAARRGSDYLPYVAAHLAVHDVVNSVYTPTRYGQEKAWPTAKRIISIGAKSETPFYGARMRCRDLGIYMPDMVEETGQIFTRHNVPPYIQRRQSLSGPELFDPAIDDIRAVTDPMLEDPFRLRFDSVLRDIAYVNDYGSAMIESYST